MTPPVPPARFVFAAVLTCALWACASDAAQSARQDDSVEGSGDDAGRSLVADNIKGDAPRELDDAGRPIPKPGTAPGDAGPQAEEPDWQLVDTVLAEIRAADRYRKPTPQDAASRGILAQAGEMDARSERVLPPFIMAPRRQTDSMVRQLYTLLPRETRRSVAFVIPDRIVQDPDAYIPYLRSRKTVVVVGNFVGIGNAGSEEGWFAERHDTELWMAEITLRLAQALKLKVSSVRYTMGDSSSSFASEVRKSLERRLHAELDALKLSGLKSPVSWGADEAVPVAMAATLAERTIRVRYAKRDARHHYDGNKTSPEVVEPKLLELGLKRVDSAADLELFVLSNVTGDDGILPDAAAQRQLDQDTFDGIHGLSAAARQNLVIVDGRMFNASLDAYSAPYYCDYLAYGAWGTFANKIGTTLASAKIVLAAGNAAAGRTLLLEAVAHDAFANGYRDGRELLKPRLTARGITFDHSGGYQSASQVGTVFEVLNALVDEKMQAHFAGTDCLGKSERVRFTPQLWRTFESEAHLVPARSGAPNVVGVYRTDLAREVFDPRTSGAELRQLSLEDLLNE